MDSTHKVKFFSLTSGHLYNVFNGIDVLMAYIIAKIILINRNMRYANARRHMVDVKFTHCLYHLRRFYFVSSTNHFVEDWFRRKIVYFAQ